MEHKKKIVNNGAKRLSITGYNYTNRQNCSMPSALCFLIDVLKFGITQVWYEKIISK